MYLYSNLTLQITVADIGLQYSPSLFPNMNQISSKTADEQQETEDELLDSKTPLVSSVQNFE